MEDDRQLAGAHIRLASATKGAHLAPPVLLSQTLNRNRPTSSLPPSGALSHGGTGEGNNNYSSAPSLYSRAGEGLWPTDTGGGGRGAERPREPRADHVRFWAHDMCQDRGSRSGSRSPGRSRSGSRDRIGRSRSGSRDRFRRSKSGSRDRGLGPPESYGQRGALDGRGGGATREELHAAPAGYGRGAYGRGVEGGRRSRSRSDSPAHARRPVPPAVVYNERASPTYSPLR